MIIIFIFSWEVLLSSLTTDKNIIYLSNPLHPFPSTTPGSYPKIVKTKCFQRIPTIVFINFFSDIRVFRRFSMNLIFSPRMWSFVEFDIIQVQNSRLGFVRSVCVITAFDVSAVRNLGGHRWDGRWGKRGEWLSRGRRR